MLHEIWVQTLTDARRAQEEALPSADVDSCGQVVSLQHEHRLGARVSGNFTEDDRVSAYTEDR